MMAVKLEVSRVELACRYDPRLIRERAGIEHEFGRPITAAYETHCTKSGQIAEFLRGLYSLAIPAAFLTWMFAGFVWVPGRHAARAIKLYSLALTKPQLVARVASQTATLFVLFGAGYLGSLILLSSWPDYAFLIAPLAGFAVAGEIGKRIYKIPVNETLGSGPIVPHRYRNLSQQVIFEQALEYYEKRGSNGTVSPESLAIPEHYLLSDPGLRFLSEAEREKTKTDPIARAAMVAAYAEEVGKSGWVRLSTERARRHELYYDHPPLKRLLLIVLAIVVLQAVVQIGTNANPWTRANVIEPIWIVSGVVFGAVFAPPRVLSAKEWEYVMSALLIVPFLFIYGGKWMRIAVTACLGYYLFYSFMALRSFIEDWNAVPWVQSFQSVRDWARVPGLGPIIEAGANYATGGLYALGKAAWSIGHMISLVAILGFSLSLWLRFFLKFNYHMWFSEAGRIFFEHRMRKPQV